MGDCLWACKTASDASHHGLYVWKFSANLLDHDGLYAVSVYVLNVRMVLTVNIRFKNPIQGIMQTNAVFSKFESAGTKSQMIGIKVVYVLMQCLLLGLGVYKVHVMGLLPTTRSDWLAWETERQPLEKTYFAFD